MNLRTCSFFESAAFNTSKPGPDYVRPDNFGDDLARWLLGQLRMRNVRVDESGPDQEDHGWYISFTHLNKDYDAVVIYIAGAEKPKWLICLERGVGLIGSILGQRHRSVAAETAQMIDEILTESELCGDVKWLYYEDVRAAKLEGGASKPLSS